MKITPSLILKCKLSFLIVLTYLCCRFIHIGLPRDIPYELTLLNLLILLGLCIFFVWRIKRILKPTASSINIYYFLKPLLHDIDSFIHSSSTWKFLMLGIVNRLDARIYSYDVDAARFVWDESKILFIHHTFPNLLYKNIILFAVIIDLFYFHRHEFLWLCLWFGLIPLMHKYFIYNLKKVQDEYKENLQQYVIYFVTVTDTQKAFLDQNPSAYYTLDTLTEILDTKMRGEESIDKFLSDTRIHFSKYGYSKKFSWVPIIKYRDSFKVNNSTHMTKEDIELAMKLYKKYMPLIKTIDDFLVSYNDTRKLIMGEVNNLYPASDKLILDLKLMDVSYFFVYLVALVYILKISIPNFHVTPVELALLERFKDVIEPFTGVDLRTDMLELTESLWWILY